MQRYQTLVWTALPLLVVARGVEAVVPHALLAIVSPSVAGDDVRLAKSAPAPVSGLGLLLLLGEPRRHLAVIVELDALRLEELEKLGAGQLRGNEVELLRNFLVGTLLLGLDESKRDASSRERNRGNPLQFRDLDRRNAIGPTLS